MSITLGDLLLIKERHGVSVLLETDAWTDPKDGPMQRRPRVTVSYCDYGEDGDGVRPVLDALEGLGATWPWGRTIPLVDAVSPLADLYGELPVVEGRPPWALRVQIHGAPRRADLPPAPRVEV